MDEILEELSELETDITNLKCVPLDTHVERVAEILDNLVDTVASIARYIQSQEQ